MCAGPVTPQECWVGSPVSEALWKTDAILEVIDRSFCGH